MNIKIPGQTESRRSFARGNRRPENASRTAAVQRCEPELKNMSERQPNVCHVVACINEDTGGPAWSVTSLAEALAQRGNECHILTLDYAGLGRQVVPDGVALHSYHANLLTRRFRGFHPAAGKALTGLARADVNLIHNHGLWMFPNRYAYRAAKRTRTPLIISPRGMLETWSLNYSRWKKQLAWSLYERRNLQHASLFHATSEAEAEAIRRAGFRQPIAILPNGIRMPCATERPGKEALTQAHPQLKDKKWLLYLSRIHPKKGLDNLLHEWRRLSVLYPDWHLVIAGSDVIGYQSKLESLVNQSDLSRQVTFTGMLTGVKKKAALSHAELFVLPTHSENFGIAIAEALSYGIPTITTKNAPWSELEQQRCGWWIEDNREALGVALGAALTLAPSERQEMGVRGAGLVKEKYSWPEIAESMAEVYRWILNGGRAPQSVHV